MNVCLSLWILFFLMGALYCNIFQNQDEIGSSSAAESEAESTFCLIKTRLSLF